MTIFADAQFQSDRSRAGQSSCMRSQYAVFMWSFDRDLQHVEKVLSKVSIVREARYEVLTRRTTAATTVPISVASFDDCSLKMLATLFIMPMIPSPIMMSVRS